MEITGNVNKEEKVKAAQNASQDPNDEVGMSTPAANRQNPPGDGEVAKAADDAMSSSPQSTTSLPTFEGLLGTLEGKFEKSAIDWIKKNLAKWNTGNKLITRANNRSLSYRSEVERCVKHLIDAGCLEMGKGKNNAKVDTMPSKEHPIHELDRRYPPSGIREVAIAEIEVTGQIRVKKIDGGNVSHLLDICEQTGSEPDPILIGHTPEGPRYVIDGHHRLEAAKRKGQTHIKAIIHPNIPFAEIVVFGTALNSKHGKQLEKRDRLNAFRIFIATPMGSGYTDEQVAEKFKVSRQTISAWRNELRKRNGDVDPPKQKVKNKGKTIEEMLKFFKKLDYKDLALLLTKITDILNEKEKGNA